MLSPPVRERGKPLGMPSVSGLLVLFFLLLHVQGVSRTIYVPDDYSAIQAAVDAAAAGDAIVVRPGTYFENIDFHGKAITLSSEKGPLVTVIDGKRAGRVVTFDNGEGPDSVLEGFTVTNGEASPGLWGYRCGGGIGCWFQSSPTITGNIVTGNAAADYGGGIYCYDSSTPVIADNVIRGNAALKGGGIFLDNMCPSTIRGNVIEGNAAAAFGGGIECWLSDAEILDNVVSGNTALYQGGGIDCNSSSPVIENNVVSGNAATDPGAGWGGGLFLVDSQAAMANNVVSGNTAARGGAVYGNYSTFTMTNDTVAGNAADYGGGIYLAYASASVENAILWGDNAPEGPEIWLGLSSYPSLLAIDHSDVKGGRAAAHVEPNCSLVWGQAMIDADPLFADAARGDFHLTWHSPCRDGGGGSVPGLPAEDFEGDPRQVSGLADIGADEYNYHLYVTGSAVPGGNLDVKVVGYPAAPVVVAAALEMLGAPLPTAYGPLYLPFPPPFRRPAGVVPSKGVLVLHATVPPGWSSGEDYALQALVGPLGGAATRLTNPLRLVVE